MRGTGEACWRTATCRAIILPKGLPLDAALLDLLSKGRAQHGPLRPAENSPLSLFIYLRLGTEGFHGTFRSLPPFEGALAPQDFLDELPGPMIAAIARACAHMAFTRRKPSPVGAESWAARA